nr:hypothetical protein [uncultured Amphritea sp.]
MDSTSNYYDNKYKRYISSGLSGTDALLEVTNSYLDGKPARQGKLQLNAAYRDGLFWTAGFLEELPGDIYLKEHFVLALARYMGQEKVDNFDLIRRIALVAPDVIQRSVRYSGLIIRANSKRWTDIERLAHNDNRFSELLKIHHIFKDVHQLCLDDLAKFQAPLRGLTPIEIITYASLYAFEHLLSEYDVDGGLDAEVAEDWRAINDILIWVLSNSSIQDLRLNDHVLGRSLKEHLSPFIFPTLEQVARTDLYTCFIQLVAAQKELNSFMSQSVDAYCYDDSIQFVRVGSRLEIVQLDKDAKRVWKRNGDKLLRLHQYWFCRAWSEFIDSEKFLEPMGLPENQEYNQLAYVKALGTQLELTEVYGVGDFVRVESGFQVNLFKALLSIELMTAFYCTDFVIPFNEYLKQTGNWRLALGFLAMEGFANNNQNRLPVTWSEKKAKIQNIRPWTATDEFPLGHAKSAEAILDFWISDLPQLSQRLRAGEHVKVPELFERPILKMGRYLFQLPWMAAFQNNSSAAINNLRRIGARRGEAREETQRIERSLASKFEEKGFQVLLNYQPVKTPEYDPGEVDLICARDGEVLVIEVKSTFLRSSTKEAWLHKHNTLRKAGLQIKRKVSAIESALMTDTGIRSSLGLQSQTHIPKVHGWIIDTCLEYDHELFSGFLKVSVEEVLIALRDDAYLLNDPYGMFSEIELQSQQGLELSQENSTLYPTGFSMGGLISVIESERVWDSVL